MITAEKLLENIVKVSDFHKASDIRIYKVQDTSVADYLLLISASNIIHIKSLLETLTKKVGELLKKNTNPDFYSDLRKSGDPASGWIILDLNSIIIHILNEETRELFELNQLFEKRGIIFHC